VVDGAPAGGARRVALLRDALAHARTATELAPASLSCAALRATLLANLLVENSTAVGARCGYEASAELRVCRLASCGAASGWQRAPASPSDSCLTQRQIHA